jgi:hypothetical protein
MYTNLAGTGQQPQGEALNMFRHTHLIELSKLFECWIAGPAIHRPLEAFFDNIDKPNLLQQSLTLFPSVEGLAPFYGNVADGLAPGVEKVIRT